MSEDLACTTASPSHASAARDDGALIISEEHDFMDCDVALPRKTPNRTRSPERSSNAMSAIHPTVMLPESHKDSYPREMEGPFSTTEGFPVCREEDPGCRAPEI